MNLLIAVLPGDGIGPEVTDEDLRVLDAVADDGGHDFRVSVHPIGGVALKSEGTALPASTLRACLAADAVFLGAVGDPAFDRHPPAERPEAGLLALRQALGGYANLRPAACPDSLIARSAYRADLVRGADLLVVRELLGGLYFGEPRSVDMEAGTAVNTMRYQRWEIDRVARVAFDQARLRRRKVTSVDKANVLETSRLWRATVTDVARDYPDVTLEHALVDSCATRLALAPTSFDVILTENLFGDILSDQAAALAGSLGLLPSATLGGRVPLFEPVHGSAPDIAGRSIANPIGAIASAAMLLRSAANLPHAADNIDHAIRDVLANGHRTRDLVGPGEHAVSTRQMGDLVIDVLAEVTDRRHSYHGV
jgi:3-isopropylmalate dehydrogenase